MTPELVLAFGAAAAAIIGAIYARTAAVQLPAIHKLVNAQYGASLLTGKISAALLREKFPDDPELERLSIIADRIYDDHMRKLGDKETATSLAAP